MKPAQIIGNDYASRLILVLLELKMTIKGKMVTVMIWTNLFSNNILNTVIGIEQQIYSEKFLIEEILNIQF